MNYNIWWGSFWDSDLSSPVLMRSLTLKMTHSATPKLEETSINKLTLPQFFCQFESPLSWVLDSYFRLSLGCSSGFPTTSSNSPVWNGISSHQALTLIQSPASVNGPPSTHLVQVRNLGSSFTLFLLSQCIQWWLLLIYLLAVFEPFFLTPLAPNLVCKCLLLIARMAATVCSMSLAASGLAQRLEWSFSNTDPSLFLLC